MSRTKEARDKRNPVKLTNWQTKNPKDGRSHGTHGRASLASAFWRGLRISMAVLLAMTFSVGSIPLNARANADVPEPMPVTERVDTNGVDNPVVAQEAMGDDADLGETDSDILKLEIASRDELEAVLSDDPALLASSSDTAATGKTVNLEITKNWEGDNADDRPESINVVVQHKDAQTGETITDGQVTLSPDSDGKWKGTLPDMPYEDSDHNRIDYLFQESFGPGGNNAQSDYDLSVGVTTKATMKNLELWVLAYNANGVSELVNGTSYTIGTGTTHASQVLRPEGPTQDVMSGNQYVFNPEEGDEAANANGMQYKTYTYFGVGDTTVENALGWTAVQNSDDTWSFISNMEQVDPQLNRTAYLAYSGKGLWKISSKIDDASKFYYNKATGAIAPKSDLSRTLYLYQKVSQDGDTPNYISSVNLCNTYSAPSSPSGMTTIEDGSLTLNVSKLWDDDEDSASLRPDSIAVSILADGVDTGKTVTLSARNNWKTKLSGLPIFKDDGKTPITYTLKENDSALPDGYTGKIEYGKEDIQKKNIWVQWDSFGQSSKDNDSYLVICREQDKNLKYTGKYTGLYWDGKSNTAAWLNGKGAPYVNISGGVQVVEKESPQHDNPVKFEKSVSGGNVTISATKDWAKTLTDSVAYEMKADKIRVKVYADGEYLGEGKDIVLDASKAVPGTTNSQLIDYSQTWAKWTNSSTYPAFDDAGNKIEYTMEAVYYTTHNTSVEDSMVTGKLLECIWDTDYRNSENAGNQTGTYANFSMHNHAHGTSETGYLKFNGGGDVTKYKDGEGDIHYGVWPQTGVKLTLKNPDSEYPYVLANMKHYYLANDNTAGDGSAKLASTFYIYKKIEVSSATQDVVLTNTYKPETTVDTGSVKIHKIDPDGDNLKGATFTIYSTVMNDSEPYMYKGSNDVQRAYYPVNTATAVVEGVERVNTSTAVTPDDGTIAFKNLELSTDEKPIEYLIVETAAPIGYEAINPIEVGPLPYAMGGSTYKDIAYTATDKKLTKLPTTGGFGILPITFAGAAIMAGCAIGIGISRRPRRGVGMR